MVPNQLRRGSRPGSFMARNGPASQNGPPQSHRPKPTDCLQTGIGEDEAADTEHY